MMSNKVILDLGFAKLVAELYNNNPGEIAPEIAVYLADDNEVVIQDIVLVKQAEAEITTVGGDSEIIPKTVQCYVWGDEWTDDPTHDLKIKMYEEEGE